jgi:nitrite reductase/ring-hydroxylating ferredoxin subunit
MRRAGAIEGDTMTSLQVVPDLADRYGVRRVDSGPVLVPKGRYLDDAYAALEEAYLWPQVWQFACLARDVAEPGQWKEYRNGSQSIVIVRADDGALRAFHNVCSHRGFRLCDGAGRGEVIRCGFHGWTYALDGRLQQVTSRKGFGTIDDADYGLRPVRVDHWGELVFVDPAADGPSLAEFLDPVPAELAAFELDRRNLSFSCTVPMPGNWKVTCDAFNEVYHLQGLHPQLMPFMDDVHTTYRVFDRGHSMMQIPLGIASPRLGGRTDTEVIEGFFAAYSTMLGPRDNAAIDLAERTARQWAIDRVRSLAATRGIDLAALADDQILDDFHYFLFPNVVLNVHADMYTLFRARPGATPHESYFDFLLFHRSAPAREVGHIDYAPGERVNEVLDQDLDGIRRVHAGLRSDGIQQLTFASFEQRLAAMHDELDRLLGMSVASR